MSLKLFVIREMGETVFFSPGSPNMVCDPAPWFFSFDGLENQQIFNHVYVKHLKVLRGLSCSRFSHRKTSLPPVSVTSTLADLCWI